ncbi:hypothetical protein [Neisseria dumasiana]|uniref:Uncharacterized protein n=1 Tax=Neisseria dumasiana TaxID=1931275 RepID=A0A1X3DHR8_9NEIS|nr:hypothetical protein [Neisseria dumasiana]OSI20427.1 hypothetical protein BV912_07605 [Neisseria dumasiana]
MKRKIFHTPHGRLMLKITSMHRNKYESGFVMTFKPDLMADFASSCTRKIEGKSKNRKMLEKGFKKFNQSQAEKLAKHLYEDLPAALKSESRLKCTP